MLLLLWLCGAGDRLYKRAQAQSAKKERASEDAAKRRAEEEEAEVRECKPHDRCCCVARMIARNLRADRARAVPEQSLLRLA